MGRGGSSPRRGPVEIQVSDSGGLDQVCAEEGREKAQNQERECFFLKFFP